MSNEVQKEEALFAGAFVFTIPNWCVKDMMSLGVQDKKYLEVKASGGAAEELSGGGYESHYQAMCREVNSEMGVQIISAKLVFVEKWTNKKTGALHRRYFYLAGEVSGLPKLDAPPRHVTETNAGNGSTEVLSCYWLPLREFARRLFRGQHPAFGAVLAQLACDHVTGQEFCNEFGDLLEQFPEPADLGLED